VKRKWIYLLLAGCMLMTACGKKEVVPSPSPTSENALDSSWEEIIERGKMVFCHTADDTSLQHFSEVLSEYIAEALGIPLEMVTCSPKQAKANIKKKVADLTFGKPDHALGYSEVILKIDSEEYVLLYRKGDKEFESLLASVLQTMANDGVFTQMSLECFSQDYSVMQSQFDTGLPTEEEAEEYDKHLKEMR